MKAPPAPSNLPLKPASDSEIEESENAPIVYVPPLSKFCNCWVVKPGITQALALASGAMAINVELLRTPSTEIWKDTVQPVGTFAGSWTLIWSSPA